MLPADQSTSTSRILIEHQGLPRVDAKTCTLKVMDTKYSKQLEGKSLEKFPLGM